MSDSPIVLIDELADLLQTSVRTIQRQMRHGSFFIPSMPRIDRKPRWSRAVVLRAIEASREGAIQKRRMQLVGK